MKRIALLVACLAAALLCGCVERTVSVTSDPPGALVYLNDEEVGRTPVKVPFTFYGTYDVRLEKDGYKPLWTKAKTDMPWWEAPGPDLVAEAFPHNKTSQHFHFTMEPVGPEDQQALVERAKQLRSTTDTGTATRPSK